MKTLQKYFFVIILLLLVVFSVSMSFVRFFVSYDYMVSYETDCNPETHSCFIGCEDDDCVDEYYYAVIEKYAKQLRQQCGKNIIGCESAETCQIADGNRCSIEYCDGEVEENVCTNDYVVPKYKI